MFNNKSSSSSRKGLPRWGVVALSILAVLALLIGWQEWRGWPWLKRPLEQRLSSQLHHDVRFDNGFAVHLLGRMRLHVGSLIVSQPAWASDVQGLPPNMIQADDVKLVVPYGGLIKALYGRRFDDIQIDEISMARLEGTLLRDKDGRANWSLDPSGKAPVTPPKEKPATMPHVRKLLVKEGLLSVEDAPLALDLKAQVSTAEGAQGDGGLRVTGKGHYRRNPFELEAKSAGVLPLLTDPEKAPPVPIVIRAEAGDSRVSFDGQTRDLLRLGDLEGTLDLKGPSLAAIGDAVGVTLPTTAVFALNGQLRKNGDVWGLAVKQLKVGATRLNGDFTFDRRPAVPLLTGKLSGSNLALADLAPAFGAPAPGAGNPKPPSGRLLPQREFDVPSLRAMDAEIVMRIDQASLGALFAQPLQPLEADLSLKGGVLTLTNVLARTAGGTLGGSVKLDGNGKTLLWDTRLNWSGIKLEYWLNMPNQAPGAGDKASTKVARANEKDGDGGSKKADGKAKDKDSAAGQNKPALVPPPPPIDTKATAQSGKPKRSYVSGELTGKAELRGEGNSTAQLLASLDGHATSWVKGGRVSRLIVEALSLHVPEAIGLWLGGDEQQPMQCAATRVLARNGQLIPEVAIVDTPSSTVLASGSVSLAKEELDLTLVSHPKTMSPLSLRTPIDVRGSFTDPSIRLHANPLGLKVLGAVALGAVAAPLAALVPLVDVETQEQGGGCARALALLERKPTPAAARR